jgi:hypothetical protein
MNMIVTRKLSVLLLGAAILACVGGDDLSLETLPGDPRFDRINVRLPVRIRPPAGATSPCANDECTVEQFEALVRAACMVDVDATPRNMSAAAGGCGSAVVGADTEICIAQRLLTVVETAAPVTYRFGTIDVEVPAQDAETDAALASLAVEVAGNAVTIVTSALLPLPTPVPPNSCTNNQLGASAARTSNPNPAPADHPLRQLTLGDELARFFGEGLDLVEAASAAAAEHGAAVSEVELSRATDVAEGARSVLSVAASRTASAHLLVGGRGGLSAIPGVAEEGFFTRRPPTGEARAALEVLRAAALDPALVSSPTVSIDQLVAGGGAVTEASSLRFRIGLYQGRATLQFASTPALAYDYLGISRRAFTQARDFLREELRAFDRLATVTLPPERFGDGTTTTAAGITLYAATRIPPRQLLPSYWAAVLRYDPTPALYTTPRGLPPAWTFEPTASGALPHGHAWGDTTAVGGTGFVDGARTTASVYQQAIGRLPDFITRLCGATGCASTTDPVQRTGALMIRALGRFGGLPGTVTGPPPTRTAASGRTAHA